MTNLRRFLQTLRRTILPRRLLQERWGDRYRSWSRVSARHEEAIPDHEVEGPCDKLGTKHTVTKTRRPRIDNYGERSKTTLVDESCALASRKRQHGRIDLEDVMDCCNRRRTHPGCKFERSGHEIPAGAYLQRNLTLNKERGTVNN